MFPSQPKLSICSSYDALGACSKRDQPCSAANSSRWASQMIIEMLSKWVKRGSPAEGKADKKRQRQNDHALQTRVSQTLDSVVKRLIADGHKKVLVVGSKEFHDDVALAAPQCALSWASCNIRDVVAGAANPGDVALGSFEAVICGGTEVAANYRIAVARMFAADPNRPVHWVANDWEFCGGTFPVPAQASDAQILLFNHFEHFFGIKDPLQFRIEICCGRDQKRLYRILGPNQSLTLRLSDFFPDRTEAASFLTFVHAPALTRGRHNRLRVCGDVFWGDSLTTLHGLHEFNRPATHKFEFRLATDDLRNSDVVLTIPNYERDMVDSALLTTIDEQTSTTTRHKDYRIDQAVVDSGSLVDKHYVGWNYAGYGGSNWFALGHANGPGGRGTISGNHHASVPVSPLPVIPMDQAERQEIGQLIGAGYFIEPYALPVARNNDLISFGFNCSSANPPYRDFILHTFDAQGRPIAQHAYHKDRDEAVFTDELPHVADDARVSLVMLTPDFERIGIRRKGFKTQFEHVVKHRGSGDWDVTEGQTSWRNVGLSVSSAAHFAGPMGSVIGRTNLVARARSSGGFRTSVVAVHASGRTAYHGTAMLKITVFNLLGQSREAEVPVPSFTSRTIWLDALWPDIEGFLGATGVGAILATSYEADINCQILTVSNAGAVSLQHMWGY
ncbi:hypothetical protein [Dongia rigui]|uniref:Uncharacterized protein n=1 Tax=Dongia rigui TaxID=940149 RepID=A0ABU5E264_9PROT|nr:hypothetical protein [Dongia rigui]MDY0873660.1 hypothetical protein [Dongia rigui]